MLLIRTQTRLLILIGILVLFFLAGMLVLQEHDKERASAFLSELKIEKTSLVNELIALRGEPIKTFAYDYTFWDDMVEFVKSGDSAWGNDNINTGLTTYKADVVWVFSAGGNLRYLARSDLAGAVDSTCFRSTETFDLAARQPFGHYFLKCGDRLMELRTAPIQPTYDIARASAPKGFFVVGRIWTNEYIASIGHIAQAAITLDLNASSALAPPPRDYERLDNLPISIPIAAPDGSLVARLNAQIAVPFAAELASGLRNTQFYVLGFGGGLLLLLGLLLYQWVSRPLAHINRSLEKRDNDAIDLLCTSRSEFGQIARLISSSFRQQARLEAEVEERRRTEKALSESDYRYRIISEQTGQMVYDWNVLTGDIYWAGAIEQITGYPEAEYQQVNIEAWEASIHPEDRDHAKEMLDLAAVKNGLYNVEYRLRRKDESYVYVEDNGVFLIDDRGEVVRMLGSMKDISERKQTQQVVIENEKRFRTLFEQSTDASLLLTDRIIDCNERACQLWGTTREEIIGRTPADFSPEYQPDGRRSALVAKELITRALAGEQMFFFWKHSTPTGQLVDCEVSLQAIKLNDNTIIHATMRDVGERKRAEGAIRLSEARLRTLVESLPHSIALKNLDLQYVIVNESYARGFGQTASHLVGLTDFDLLEQAQAEQAMIEDFNILAANETSESESESIENGEIKVRHIAKIPVRDNHGITTGLLVVLSDFSERRRLELALLQSQKMEAVGRLAGGVAHDFNNLLTVISSYTQLIMDDLKPEQEIYSSVDEIRKASDRASNLTRQLLAFSRKSISEPRILDLNAVITDMEKMFRRIIGEDIEMQLRQETNIGRIFADPGHIEQVLTNLVVNARDAMPLGGKLTVTTRTFHSEGEQRDCGGFDIRKETYSVLEVTDTGVGMSPEVKARIFEPFFTTKGTGKGTGLGLATVFGIVNQSSGYIQVHSQPGQGTTFRVFLPNTTEQATNQQSAESLGHLLAGIAGQSILLVEDEDSVRQVTCKMLEQQGFVVTAVAGGAEAMLAASKPEAKFDLLLTDVVMPGMNGKEVADAILGLLPEIKIAYMSGYTDDAIVSHGVLEEGIHFIRKPFIREDLVNKVLQAIGV